jgi:hypothetical protein
MRSTLEPGVAKSVSARLVNAATPAAERHTGRRQPGFYGCLSLDSPLSVVYVSDGSLALFLW